jgi:hypothetical protein
MRLNIDVATVLNPGEHKTLTQTDILFDLPQATESTPMVVTVGFIRSHAHGDWTFGLIGDGYFDTETWNDTAIPWAAMLRVDGHWQLLDYAYKYAVSRDSKVKIKG